MLAPEGFLMSEWQLPGSGRVLRAVLRVALVFAVVWASLQLIEFATQALSDAGKTPDPVIMEAAFWGMTALYALVLAIPFVPGVEIGLSMMMIRGADAALPVYLATIAGLTLAYLVGRYVRYPVLARWLSDFGMVRTSARVETLGGLERGQKLDLLRARLPGFLRWLLVDYRYLALGLLLNLPGNAIVGGGGGILLITGLSRLFDTRLLVLTLIIAVAPVPLAFLLFGAP